MAHTLLLADDSVTIQRVIELTFADEDVHVVAVSDGDQAIARIDTAPPDIVLADASMPGRDGYEVARHIKTNPKLAHIPVVLLAGAFEPIDPARAQEVGTDGVLEKPFEPQRVISRVKELLAAVPIAASSALSALRPDDGEITLEPPSTELDEYFDRLDEAFAKLSAQPAARPTPVAPFPGEPIEHAELAHEISSPVASETPSSQTQLPSQSSSAWTALRAPDPIVPIVPVVPTIHAVPGLSYASPHEAFELDVPDESTIEVVDEHAYSEHTHGAGTTDHGPRTDQGLRTDQEPRPKDQGPDEIPLPSLTAAFAAILAAEQNAPTPSAAPAWPLAAVRPPAPPPTIEITDELVQRIAAQVLERLSDHVVRETTTEIVGRVADRMVREEIERIKAAIR